MTKEEAVKALRLERGIEINGNAVRVAEFLQGLDVALATLRPVSREQIEQNKRRWEVQTNISPYYYCSGCGESFEIHSYDKEKYRFCPYCMSPMTDEAVDIVMEKLEALQ